MTQHLIIHHPDAIDDPYVIESREDLEYAVEAEAAIVASDAGSELLESPDDECRDELKARVMREALAALDAGDDYRDPVKIRWELRDA